MATEENMQSIDNLLEAIDIIASSRVRPETNGSQVIKATVVDTSDASKGFYGVEDSTEHEYTVQSENLEYQENDIVYILISNNDNAQTGFILGKWISPATENQYATISNETKQDFVGMDEITLIPPDPLPQDWPQLSKQTFTISSDDLVKFNTYDRVLLDMVLNVNLPEDLADNLKTYNCTLKIVSRDTVDEENGQQEVTHIFSFGSKDVFGNPNDLVDSNQSIVFNLEEVGTVLSAEFIIERASPVYVNITQIQVQIGYSLLQATQPSIILSSSGVNVYTSQESEEARQRAIMACAFYPSLENDTFIGLNRLEDLPEIYQLQFFYYDSASTEINPIYGEHWKELSTISLQGIDPTSDENNSLPCNLKQDIVLPLTMQTAQYCAALTYIDKQNSLIDNFLTGYDIEINELFGSNPIIDITFDDQTFDSRVDLLQYILTQKWLIDINITDSEQESLWGEVNEDKTALLTTILQDWHDKYPVLTSNQLSFLQTNFTMASIIGNTVDNVTVTVDQAFSGGIFNNYYSNNLLINTAEQNVKRIINLNYRTVRIESENIEDFDQVEWYFPLEATMIRAPEENIEYERAELHENEAYADRYEEIVITSTITADTATTTKILNLPYGQYAKITKYAIENDSFGGDDFYCYQTCAQVFRISNNYDFRNNNNSIYCAIKKKNTIVYMQEIPLTFSSSGGQGIDVTFQLGMYPCSISDLRDSDQAISYNIDYTQMTPVLDLCSLTTGTLPHSEIAIIPRLINEEHYELTRTEIAQKNISYSVYCYQGNKWDWSSLNFINNWATIYTGDNWKCRAFLTPQKNLIIVYFGSCTPNDRYTYFNRFTVRCTIQGWQTPVKYPRNDSGVIMPVSAETLADIPQTKTIDLVTYCPIPCINDLSYDEQQLSNNKQYSKIQGSNIIKYSSLNNLYPEYSKLKYEIFMKDTDPISSLFKFQMDVSFGGTLLDILTEGQRFGSFEPDSVFSNKDNFTIYSLQGVTHSGYADITFPILVFNDAYANTVFNNWDGKLTINPDGEDESYILASMLGAGVKDSENRFTGVVMGKLSSNSLIGLYGFKEGIATFGFKTDGTAFIGAPESNNNSTIGGLVFDGINSVIQSGNFNGQVIKNNAGKIISINPQPLDSTKTPVGSIIDLKNGYFSFGGGNLTFNGTTLAVKGTVRADDGYIGNLLLNNGELVATQSDWRVTLRGVIENQPEAAVFFITDMTKDTPAYSKNERWPFMIGGDGCIYATKGEIAGFTMEYESNFDNGHKGSRLYVKGSDNLYTGINSVGLGPAFFAGGSTRYGDGANPAIFRVYHDGRLYAAQADITGTITSTEGSIGNINLSEDGLSSAGITISDYQMVENPTGNPHTNSYYEVGSVYVTTHDTSVVSNKTYYQYLEYIQVGDTDLDRDNLNPSAEGWFVKDSNDNYSATTDTSVNTQHTYYRQDPDFYLVPDPPPTDHTPIQYTWYEQAEYADFHLTNDTWIVPEKEYYQLNNNATAQFFLNRTGTKVFNIVKPAGSASSIFNISSKGAVFCSSLSCSTGSCSAATFSVRNTDAKASNTVILSEAYATKGKSAKVRVRAWTSNAGKKRSGILQVSGAGNFGLYSDSFSRWVLYYSTDGYYMTLGDPNKYKTYYHAAIDFRFHGDSKTKYFAPRRDNYVSLGLSNRRWSNVYAGTLWSSDGTVHKSDKKVKNHIQYLNDNDQLEQFMMDLKPAMYTLSYGTGHRHHMGLYAQDVSVTAHNTIGDIAAYKASVNSPNTDETYYNPNIDDKFLEWGLDYSELIAPTIALLQKTTMRVKELEQEIEQLKQQIN